MEYVYDYSGNVRAVMLHCDALDACIEEGRPFSLCPTQYEDVYSPREVAILLGHATSNAIGRAERLVACPFRA